MSSNLLDCGRIKGRILVAISKEAGEGGGRGGGGRGEKEEGGGGEVPGCRRITSMATSTQHRDRRVHRKASWVVCRRGLHDECFRWSMCLHDSRTQLRMRERRLVQMNSNVPS